MSVVSTGHLESATIPMAWGTWCCFLCTIAANILLATSCPTWHYYNNATGKCECGFWLLCSSDGNQVEIDNSRCATSSERGDDYYIALCPFRHIINNTNRLYSEMPSNTSQLDEVMCGPYNRRGFLCGECEEGYGPAAFGLKCAKCSSPWSGYAIYLYLFLEFVTTTLIFIGLVMFRLKLTSGPLLGYVLLCQINVIYFGQQIYMYGYIISNVSVSLKVLFTLSVTMSQFWNLQFFKTILPPFCIGDNVSGIQAHMLNFIPTIYPFVLIIISCILMELHARNVKIIGILLKQFTIFFSKARITPVTGDAVFQAFASLIFLSNTSAISALFQLSYTANVYNSTMILQRQVFYRDPTVEWASYKYLPYLLIAVLVSFFISVIPSVLLCLYPTRVYRYLSRFLSARKRLAITAFAEALHSCFKDGLNGTRDYRALAGAQLFLILLGTVASMFINFLKAHNITMDVATTYTVEIFLWMMFVCLVSYLKPCKSAIANVSLSFHLILCGIILCVQQLWWYDSYARTYPLQLTFITIFLSPHILVALWAGYTLTKHTLTRFGCQFHGPGCKEALSDMANGVRLCLSRRYRGYQELQEQCETTE